EDVRRVDMNVITNDFSQIQAFPLNALSNAACTLPRQTPKFAHTQQQLRQCAPAVGVCWSLSGTVGRVQHVQSDWVKLQNVCPMKRDFQHSDSSSAGSQLGSTRVHNILELSWMSLLCWLSASLLKKPIS